MRERPGFLREMTDTATRASPTAGPKHAVSFAIATIAAIFMTVTGALGTDEAPFLIRLIFWLISMESGALIGMGVTTGIRAWGRLRRWLILEAMLVATLIALPLTLIVISARSIMFGLEFPSLIGVANMFGYVLFVSLIITALDYAMVGRDPLAQAPVVEAEAKAIDARFRERLPHHLRESPILALQSEDHYLRVHCEGGDALILMRLSDAIGELADEGGAQVHRSWWIAQAAIDKVSPGDGRAVLTLRNGVEAPVSRSNYQALKKSGWFA